MKVAIVHYWFVTRRGGEKVVESILNLFPEADIYTLFYDESTYGNYISKHQINTSILNTGFLKRHYQKIFPLYPLGIRSLKLKKDYDLIISSESGPAKGINLPPNALHICYIHTPMRYCWGFTQEYLNSMHKAVRPIAKFFFNRLKRWDITTIQNVDFYIANSVNVANRVNEYYKRDADVIHPPIELALFEKPLIKNSREVYLSFGAITPYKRIDLLVETFNRNNKVLYIVGDGSEKLKLKSKANSNIRFFGNLEWHQIEDILRKTRALIFPGVEDFGMIPLEVMAYGIPVLAYNQGGALETVIDNPHDIGKSSGLFFEFQTPESIEKCIINFEKVENEFNREWIRNHARSFGEDRFLNKVRLFLQEKINS